MWITTSICRALFLFYGFGKTPFVSSSNDALFISVELENTTLNLDTFFIPTAITPNNDGLNDNFRTRISPDYNYEIGSYTFTIYDRKGFPLITTDDPSLWWTGGRSYLKETYAPDGMHTCQVIVKFEGDDFFHQKKMASYNSWLELILQFIQHYFINRESQICAFQFQ